MIRLCSIFIVDDDDVTEGRCSTPNELKEKDPLSIYSSLGFTHPASLMYGGWFAATAAALSGNSSNHLLGLHGTSPAQYFITIRSQYVRLFSNR